MVSLGVADNGHSNKQRRRSMATTQAQVDTAFATLKTAATAVRTSGPNITAAANAAADSMAAFDIAMQTYVNTINNSTTTQAQIDSAEANVRAKEQAMVLAHQALRDAQAAGSGAPAAFTAAAGAYSTAAKNLALGT
jgi:hypothetical protein